MFRKIYAAMYLNIVNTLRQLPFILFNNSLVSSTGISTNLQNNLQSNKRSTGLKLSSSNLKRSKNIRNQTSVHKNDIPDLVSNTSCMEHEESHINDILNHTTSKSSVSGNSISRNHNDTTLSNIYPSTESSAPLEAYPTEDEIYSIFSNLNAAIGDIDGSIGIYDEPDFIEAGQNIIYEIEKDEHFIEIPNFNNDNDSYSTVSVSDIISIPQEDVIEEVIDEVIDDYSLQQNKSVTVFNTYTHNINLESDHNIDSPIRSECAKIYTTENPLFEGVQDLDFLKQGESTLSRKRPKANIEVNGDSNSTQFIKKLKKKNILEYKEPEINQFSQIDILNCFKKISESLWSLCFSINDQRIMYQYNPQISTTLFMECLSSDDYRSVTETTAMNSIVLGRQKLRPLQVSFAFPKFTSLKFQAIGTIKYLKLNILSNDNSLNVIIRGTIYFTEMSPKLTDYAFLLENTFEFDYTILFHTLLNENFPIYSFSNIPHNCFIKFENSYSFKSRGKLSMRKYLTDFNRKIFQLHVRRNNKNQRRELSTLMCTKKPQFVDWKTSTKLAIEYINFFCKKIFKIITKFEDRRVKLKKEDLYRFINNIINGLKYEWNIQYSHNRDDLYSEEEEIISLCIFLHQEVRLVLEYWNKYFFRKKQSKYVDNRTLLEVYLKE